MDAATFVSGASGTCVDGGGVEVTGGGQLQIKDAIIGLSKITTAFKNNIFPIGIICETTNSDHDTAAKWATAVGIGTWEAYGAGRVLVSAGSTTDSRSESVSFSLGASAGEFNHLLTAAELPNHTHNLFVTNYQGGDDCAWGASATSGEIGGNNINREARTSTANSGKGAQITGGTAQDIVGVTEGQVHNNLQPYIVVYRYRRIS